MSSFQILNAKAPPQRLHAQRLIISDPVGLITQTPRERFSSNHRVCVCVFPSEAAEGWNSAGRLMVITG